MIYATTNPTELIGLSKFDGYITGGYTMTPVKIKITVRDKALEMQVLEQDWIGEYNNGDLVLISGKMYIPCLSDSRVWVGASIGNGNRESLFDSNLDRDAYLARVKKLMHDFRVAWQAGEVEVGR